MMSDILVNFAFLTRRNLGPMAAKVNKLVPNSKIKDMLIEKLKLFSWD